jgi:predicted nuclease of restriction endonuclease-like RecB superfamily
MIGSQSQEIVKAVIDIEEENFSQLKSGLSEYIRKQSYEFLDKDRKAVRGLLLGSV